ncbi:MAG: hypothetical protein WCK16_02935 [Candidatus Moraniibacteriota bacterium]|jgi:flagellar basal body-associated protein FliL
MDRKKIIVIIALVVLVGGIATFAVWIKNKTTKAPITAEQKVFADKFARDMQIEKDKAKKNTVNMVEEGKGNKTSNRIVK